MDIVNLINRLNNELDKLNQIKNNNFDTSSFFTTDEHFNDSNENYIINLKNNSEKTSENESDNSNSTTYGLYENIKPDTQTKSLIVAPQNHLMTAQLMFKKTIRFSLKSFLISISLSFLNLFI